MDIAYLHLFSVKWAPKTAVHLGGEQRSDDDNPPAASTQDPPPSKQPDANTIDFLTWDITNCKSVPWEKLSLSLSGSGNIAGLQAFYDEMKAQVEKD